MVKVCVGLMATCKQSKYREFIHGCCTTWIQDYAKQDEDVFLFCGEYVSYGFEAAMEELTQNHAKFVHLNGIEDNYASASIKQWIGLAYMRENVDADFYLIIGTDNYVNKTQLDNLASKYDHNLPFLIGGYSETRHVGFILSFPLGGGGLMFTKTATDMLLLKNSSNRLTGANELINSWNNLCNMANNKLHAACDVAAAFFAWICDIPTVKEKSMYPCSWTSKFCNPDVDVFPLAMNHNNISICHYMTTNDMISYRKYLKHDKVMNYVSFLRFYEQKSTNSKSFSNNKWVKNVTHHPQSVLVVGDDTGDIFLHIIREWLTYESDNERTLMLADISIAKFEALTAICSDLVNIKVIRVTANMMHNRECEIAFYNSLKCYGTLNKYLCNLNECKQKILIFGTEVFEEQSELCDLDLEMLSERYNMPADDLRNGTQKAIDKFVNDNSQWSEDVVSAANYLAKSMKDNKGGSLISGGVTFLNNRNYCPRIIDICIYSTEKELLKLRVKELYEHVSEFIVLEGGIVNSSAEPRMRTFDDVDGLEEHRDKIRYVELEHSEPVKQTKDHWQREAFFRDYPMHALGLRDDDVVILCDVDEIWDPNVVIPWVKENYAILGSGVFTLSMIFHYYNFNWVKKFKWDMPFISTAKVVRERGAEDIRKNKVPRDGKVEDAGWHLSYFGTPEELIQKVSMFCHQEFNKEEFTNKKHIEQCIADGTDIFKRGDGENLTRAVDLKRPKYYFWQLSEIYH